MDEPIGKRRAEIVVAGGAPSAGGMGQSVTGEDPTHGEDPFAAWLDACEQALANGEEPPVPPADGPLPPEFQDVVARGLAGLKLVRQLRPRRDVSEPGSTVQFRARGENSRVVELPWERLG